MVWVELGVIERGGAAEQWGMAAAAYGGDGSSVALGGGERAGKLQCAVGELVAGLIGAEEDRRQGLHGEQEAAALRVAGGGVRRVWAAGTSPWGFRVRLGCSL